MEREFGIIYARLNDDTIGMNNKLPWFNLEHDMRNFKKVTTGNIIIMGKNTFESIGNNPLINRINIIVSKTLYDEYLKKTTKQNLTDLEEIQYTKYTSSVFGVSALKNKNEFTKSETNIFIVETADDAISLTEEYKNKNVYFIGGKSIFEFGYKYCNAIYETVVNDSINVCTGNDIITTFNVKSCVNNDDFDNIWKKENTLAVEPKYGPSYEISKYTTDIVNITNKISSMN